MNETFRWAIGILVTVQLAVIGFVASALWKHVTDCKNIRGALEGVAVELARIKEDIGTHERGLRGQAHTLGNFVDALEKRVFILEQK